MCSFCGFGGVVVRNIESGIKGVAANVSDNIAFSYKNHEVSGKSDSSVDLLEAE